MDFIWVLGRYTAHSDHGKYVLSLIGEGIGYHLLNKERAKSEDIIVGFKYPTIKPLPHHLEPATPTQTLKLDDLDMQRRGARK